MGFSLVSNHVVTTGEAAFVVSAPNGDLRPGTLDGLYALDTRYLSRFTLRVDGRPLDELRSGTVGEGLTTFYVLEPAAAGDDSHDLSVVRDRQVDGALQERISLVNHGARPRALRLTLEVQADFADLFEVRRFRARARRRCRLASDAPGRLRIGYRRRGFERETTVECDPAPRWEGATAVWDLELAPRSTWQAAVRVVPARPESPGAGDDRTGTLGPPSGRAATRRVAAAHARRRDPESDPFPALPALETVHLGLRNAFERAVADLRALCIRPLAGRLVLAAGLPWFMTVFGRDSIIAALQVKVLGPRLMGDTLHTLAHYQAREIDPYRESEPGKIPHEIRRGELAHFGDVPHSRYYGSVDATPLFLVLLAEWFQWTGDEAALGGLLPAAEAALAWIDEHGDLDGDGFVEYGGARGRTLTNQCWKDSEDSVAFADGRLAEGPIAPVEVQGYVYQAKRGMAGVYRALGDEARARALEREAERLRLRFHEAFWMPREGFYALALDGRKRQVDAIASNPGHCLWSGMVPEAHAEQVRDRLLAPEMFSGWGIRTLSSRMERYHPLSYHNGSVWPHDNALVAAGLARYGFHDAAEDVISGLLEAAASVPEHRLPELFAGYPRRAASFPVPYPGANAPQAWAAGAVIYAVELLLRLHPDGDLLVSDMPPMGRSLSLRGVPYRGGLWGF